MDGLKVDYRRNPRIRNLAKSGAWICAHASLMAGMMTFDDRGLRGVKDFGHFLMVTAFSQGVGEFFTPFLRESTRYTLALCLYEKNIYFFL